MVGKKVASVGNKPGVTKTISWIRINDKLELMDTPGILWPKIEDQVVAYNLATFSSIKDEILPIDEVACYILKYMFYNYPKALEERYGITDITDMVEVYDTIGKKRGCLISGGEIDYDRVVDVVIRDFNNNSFGGITLDR